MKIRASILSLLALAGLFGCTELNTFTRNECGNGVIEDGEYCDGTGFENGLECIQVGMPGACHFQCNYFTDGLAPDAIKKCPTGQGCGIDGVCRGAAKRFEEPISYVGDRILGFGAGDFNGNGRTDLVTYSTSRTDIHYFDESGNEGNTFSIPGFPDQPVLSSMDLPADAGVNTTDLLMRSGDSLSGFLGQPDGTMKPIIFSAGISVGGGDLHSISPLWSNPENIQQSIALIFDPDGAGASGLKIRSVALDEPPVQGMVGAVDIGGVAVRGRLASGFLIPGLPCEALVFMTDDGMGGAAYVNIYQSCQEDMAAPGKYIKPTQMAGQIKLPDDRLPWEGVWLADIRGDGRLDILYGTSAADGSDKRIFIADIDAMTNFSVPFTLSAKSFLRVIDVTGDKVWDPMMRPEEVKCEHDPNIEPKPTEYIANAPLAFGDIDGDGSADLIDTLGILVNTNPAGDQPYRRFVCLDRDPWNAAVIGDLNAGITDIAVASSDQRGIFFLNGAPGGLFTSQFIATNDYVREMRIGDYDGDLMRDLLVLQTEIPNSIKGASDVPVKLSLLYGNVVGAPDEPVPLGSLNGIISAEVGYVWGKDAATEFLVAAQPPDKPTDAYIFNGRADRLFVAPLVLLPGEGMLKKPKPSLPRQIIPGQFGGTDAGDAVVITEEFDKENRTVRFWMLKDIGSSDFTAVEGNDVTEYGVSEQAFMQHAFGIQLDPEGNLNPNSEAVVLGLDENMASRFWIASFQSDAVDPTKTNIAVTSSQPLDMVLMSRFKTSPILQPFDTLVKTEDIDGDGLVDIAGILEDNSAAVIWNNGTGTIDPEKPLLVPVDGKQLWDIAFANMDADKELEIILLTDQGIFKVDLNGRDLGEMSVLSESLLAERAVGGDFNGDGVDDLVIGGEGGFSLLLGAVLVPTYDPDDTINQK